MKRLLVMPCIVALLLSVGGCSGGDAETETQKYIDQLNALSEAIEKKDEEKAKSIVNDIKETEKRLKEIKVTESQKKKLEEKFTEPLKKAGFRYGVAIASNPELAKKVNYMPSP